MPNSLIKIAIPVVAFAFGSWLATEIFVNKYGDMIHPPHGYELISDITMFGDGYVVEYQGRDYQMVPIGP